MALQSRMRGNFEAGWRKDVPAVRGEGKRDFLEAAGDKISCHCCQAMKSFTILSLKQCNRVGDGRRDSDDENDASTSVKTDAVAGTFKQHRKLQWSMEFRLYVYFSAVALPHDFVDTEEQCLQSQKAVHVLCCIVSA